MYMGYADQTVLVTAFDAIISNPFTYIVMSHYKSSLWSLDCSQAIVWLDFWEFRNWKWPVASAVDIQKRILTLYN